MNTVVLRNKEDFEIGGRRYFVAAIPAIPAQRMLFQAFGALSGGGVSAIPPEVVSEMIRYAGTYNDSGAEVQFVSENIVSTLGVPLDDLLEIEVRLVEKNFGFLGDGSLGRLVERLAKVFMPAKKEGSSDTRTSTPSPAG